MEEDENNFIKKVMAALDQASVTHEFIGVCQSKATANYQPKRGGKVKTLHYRVFTEDGTDGSAGHVEVFFGAKRPRIIEFK